MTLKPKVHARRRALAVLAGAVICVGVLLFGVFPTRNWWDQRQETADVEAELAAIEAERATVEREIERLETPEEIARRAKADLGYVNPGEDAYAILPAPTDPIGLPEGWPFTGVERVLGAS